MPNPYIVLAVILFACTARAEDKPPEKLYEENCLRCHGPKRLGGMGPALLPSNLSRLKKGEAENVIANGRLATQMPPFKGVLHARDIAKLAAWIYTAPAEAPVWDVQEIRASHIRHADPATLSAKPRYAADPMNLFVVVEVGDHHVTILDGDKFEPMARFGSRFALHGGPKFSPDGRFVYFASRDGWISKYDLYNLTLVAEVRAGINTRNLAISHDGRFVLVGNYLPQNVVLFDAGDLSLRKLFAVKNDAGETSRVSAVYQAAPRQSFVVALKDLPEVWEIGYAKPTGKGQWVHDYRPESGDMLAALQTFPLRRIKLADYLDDFSFDPTYRYVLGTSRGGKTTAQVVDLDEGKKIADIEIPGMPHLGSGITWSYKGEPVIGTPNLGNGKISVVRLADWKVVGEVETLGPGFFVRSHENTPFAWADSMMSKHKDTVEVFDKRDLKLVKKLRPAPGRTTAHVEFDKTGEHALVSIHEIDGAIVVYDAKNFKEVKRIPMVKPLGKYNVHNKVNLSEGTSH